MLSPNDEYRGGGTFMRCLQCTLKLGQGQVLVHPGKLFHSGMDITEGTREYVVIVSLLGSMHTDKCLTPIVVTAHTHTHRLMICFMDGLDPDVVDTSDGADDCDEYRNQVLELRS